MSYPIIICEDSLVQLHQIDTLVQNYILFHNENFQIALKTQSPEEVQMYLKKFHPVNGIYFLDIDLNHQINGIDLAESIRQVDVQAKIIFVTTHDEMAPLTLKRKVEALDFIAKDQPLEKIRSEIYEALDFARQRIDETKTSQRKNFSFSIGTQLYNMDINEILFVETSDIPHRLDLFTVNGKYEFYGKLNNIEKKYLTLFRASRSCLVNLTNIRKVDFPNRILWFNDELFQKFSVGKGKKIKKVMDI